LIRDSIDFLLIGGDIAPKGLKNSVYVQIQRLFLEEKLTSYFQQLKRARPECQVYLMLGNDDSAVNSDVLNNHPDLYHVIANRRLKLTDSLDIVGYPYVPITPFACLKEWEKFDLSKFDLKTVPEILQKRYLQRKELSYCLNGSISTPQGRIPYQIDPKTEANDSIQNDLKSKIFTESPQKTIYVMHAPPDNTNLDQVDGKLHTGSMALRLFIEKYQPYLTLHGHIHETVEISGNFHDRIGRTVCFGVGNHNIGRDLAILTFDLYHPETVRRIVI